MYIQWSGFRLLIKNYGFSSSQWGTNHGTLYAEVKMTKTGSALVFVDPTGMAQVKKWGNKNFEHESVTNINDVKTTGGPVFSLAKLSNSSSALLMTQKK